MDLLIRTDASALIGTGHVMRCLALAQAWQDAGEQAIFTMAMCTPALEARLQSEGVEINFLATQPGSTNDAIQTADRARQREVSWVVVDGYHFGAAYQSTLKGLGLRLLFIDDNGHTEQYDADIVLNQNLHAHEELYANRDSHTQLLLGARYALIRREFLRWRKWERETPKVARRVLVTLGGSDPQNVTLEAIQALQRVGIDGLEVVIVVGGSNPHYEELRSAACDLPHNTRVESDVTSMPELMAWADLAVSAGGSTSLELAFMRLPALTFVLAHNQRLVAERLDEMGVTVNLGWHEDLSPVEIAHAVTQLLRAEKQRAEMSRRGQELVDGEGVTRILAHIKDKTLRLRQVVEGDCRLLWGWVNDPDTRAASFSTDPIPWEHHVRWFKTKLNDPGCFFYIALSGEGAPVGQVRYDVDGNQAVISVSIDPKSRRKGYGSKAIQIASQEFFATSSVGLICAYVKQDNEASVRSFFKAGFRDIGTTTVQGHQTLHFILRRDQ